MKLLQGEICISSAVQHECDVLNYVQCKMYGKLHMNVLFRRCCILLLLVWQVKRISVQSQTIKAESKQGLELLKQNLIQAQTVKIQPSHIATYSPAHPKFFMTWLLDVSNIPFLRYWSIQSLFFVTCIIMLEIPIIMATSMLI